MLRRVVCSANVLLETQMSILQFSIMCESLHFFSTEKQKLGCLVRGHFFGGGQPTALYTMVAGCVAGKQKNTENRGV